MQDIQLFFNKLSGLLWGWPMIIALLGTHVFDYPAKIPATEGI